MSKGSKQTWKILAGYIIACTLLIVILKACGAI